MHCTEQRMALRVCTFIIIVHKKRVSESRSISPDTITLMDPCWKQLPRELVDYICGTWLPRVRGMSRAFQNELKMYVSSQGFFRVLHKYADMYGIYRAQDVFCHDMFNMLNDYQEECHSPFLIYNVWNTDALWAALSEEQKNALQIEI